ncbi:hypothetical protein [Variovorax sp. J22R115]|uniref:hypothetical protein n=1 Tax=Variovorax sp. J22R115 TaxID=3053509 RepID=UPI0025772B07|nr:hypothetical protein [Variovorax sp. J22R115]MDM0048863.1 hypothetical protein [Variovorax sp. J22R115]
MIRFGFIVLFFGAIAAVLLVPGCSTPNTGSTGIAASNNAEAKIRKVGFLTDPGRLKPTPGDEGILCWLQPGVKWRNGYVSSFTSWSYARDAFNKWSEAFAHRFTALRAST